MSHLLGKVAATAVALAVLTGCGGGPSSSPGATGPSSGTTSSPTSDTSGPSPSATPGAPATGPELDVEGFSVRTPPAFDHQLAVLARNKAVTNVRTGDQITAAYISSIGQLPLEQAVQLAKRNTLGGDKLKRLTDAEIAGQTFYHLAGPTGVHYTEEYGAIVAGALCFVRFDFSSPPAARQKIMAGTMASFTLD